MIRGLSHNVDSRHASVFIRPECDAETHSDFVSALLTIRVFRVIRVRLNGSRTVFFLGFALFFCLIKVRPFSLWGCLGHRRWSLRYIGGQMRELALADD